jgi:RNA polymerase sigma-70 factor (ECF subfamily)
MPDSPTYRVLLDRWRAGDEAAARQLFDLYVERLMALARRRISQRLNSRVDPEDVVQSVFRTFFGHLKEGHFQIQDQDDLSKLLVRITVHKTLRQIAFHKAAKRDPNHETGQGDEPQERLLELLDREPTPDSAVEFLDQLDHFLGHLRPLDREILRLRMEGYKDVEIAELLGISDRKIRRLMERVRGLAEQEGLTP